MKLKIGRFLAFQFLLQIRNLRFLIARIEARDDNDIVTREIHESEMILDLKDQGISKDLALDGTREPESTALVKKEIKKGDTVVDIGANIGYYTLLESRLVGNKGKVYAIEPIDKNTNSLTSNIELNKYTNIDVFRIAIGEKHKIEKMYIAEHSNWNSFVNHKQGIIGTKYVQVTSLDAFVKNRRCPDFVRMDVEGYEYTIIKGMKNILKSKEPLKLFIELHPHLMKKEHTIYLLETLKKYGFETKAVIRSVTVLEMKVMDRSQYDYSYMSINDLINNDDIVNGKLGAFEIFFERNSKAPSKPCPKCEGRGISYCPINGLTFQCRTCKGTKLGTIT